MRRFVWRAGSGLPRLAVSVKLGAVMQIDEAYAGSQAPAAAASNNAKGVVIKRKLVALFKSLDGTRRLACELWR